VLLVYGLTNLAKMQEDSLDKMDPYQRGATDISKHHCCICGSDFIALFLRGKDASCVRLYTMVCWWVLSPTRKKTSYSDQTRGLFNTLPTKLNTLL